MSTFEFVLEDGDFVFELGAQQGPSGPPGSGTGSGAAAYEHSQPSAAATWTINHNLGYRPSIVPLSTGGAAIVGEILHVSVNQALVLFDTPRAGLATCS